FCVCVGFSFLGMLWRSVCCISVAAPAEVSVVRGGTVTLTCSFTSSSSITSHMSIDWTFRPDSGGPAKTIFHFSSQAYLPEDDYFKGRVKWAGSPSRGEASIQLLNASLTDNGTYTCAVRNPPDVHGHPAQTVLTVTPQSERLIHSTPTCLTQIHKSIIHNNTWLQSKTALMSSHHYLYFTFYNANCVKAALQH
uniref:Ig-like domain-containing protein n=1 Tax=Cyprinus carpio TaxID=7962 RepID=A0A8C1JM70_CYPCA